MDIGYTDSPGDVRVCGRVSWRQTSCRGGHYPFSDYGTVVLGVVLGGGGLAVDRGFTAARDSFFGRFFLFLLVV